MVNNLQLTNLLSGYGAYGILGAGTAAGAPTLAAFVTNLIYKNIVFINTSGASAGSYPASTFWNTQNRMAFSNVSASNYQLSSASPYHNAGSDGKDIGVWDWNCLNSDSAAALAGTFVPGSGGCAVTASLSGQDSPPQPPSSLTSVVQ